MDPQPWEHCYPGSFTTESSRAEEDGKYNLFKVEEKSKKTRRGWGRCKGWFKPNEFPKADRRQIEISYFFLFVLSSSAATQKQGSTERREEKKSFYANNQTWRKLRVTCSGGELRPPTRWQSFSIDFRIFLSFPFHRELSATVSFLRKRLTRRSLITDRELFSVSLSFFRRPLITVSGKMWKMSKEKAADERHKSRQQLSGFSLRREVCLLWLSEMIRGREHIIESTLELKWLVIRSPSRSTAINDLFFDIKRERAPPASLIRNSD